MVTSARRATYVNLKLGSMRKAQEFIVRVDKEDQIYIQSDRCTGRFDKKTGVGVFNHKGCYFIHLNEIMGARPLTLTADQLAQVLEFALKSGDELGPGVILA